MVISCNNKKEDPATEQTTLTPDGNSINVDPAMGAQVSGTTEAHFKCPKNCEGGTGDAKGPCPVCGTEMAHNQAFHAAQNTAAGAPGSSPATPIQVDPSTITTGTPNPVTTQPAAQTTAGPNAKGVWHYTCSKGCEGGAGAAGNCAKCGNALTHNQAFHQ